MYIDRDVLTSTAVISNFEEMVMDNGMKVIRVSAFQPLPGRIRYL